jgi:hypothetical protein
VRVGVSNLLNQMKKRRPKDADKDAAVAVVRPWIQGMPWHAPSFGPQYIADQVGHADKGGATGWMVWNPSQDYTATWQGVPVTSSKGARRAANENK